MIEKKPAVAKNGF